MKAASTVLFFCLMMNATIMSQAISRDTTAMPTRGATWSRTPSKDTVAVLNTEQLRTTALIFAEHEFLQK